MLFIHEPTTTSRVISDGVDNDHSPQRFFGSSQAAAVHVTLGVVCARAVETSCRNNIAYTSAKQIDSPIFIAAYIKRVRVT